MFDKIKKAPYQTTAFLVITICYTLFFSINHLSCDEWQKASFRRLVDGTATTPMQYRVLIPWIARLIESFIPIPWWPFINHLTRVRFLLELSAVFMLIVTYVWTTYRLLADVILVRKPYIRLTATWLALLFFLLALPFHYFAFRINQAWYYPSDIPSLIFITLGFFCVLSGRYKLMYIAFLLGALNRETIIFVTVFYVLIAYRSHSGKLFYSHVVIQVCIWFAVKAFLYALYGINTNSEYADFGGIFKNTFYANISSLQQPHLWALLPCIYGFFWIPLILLTRYIRPTSLKRGILVIPLFILLMMIPGEIYEVRIYAEMLPLVVWGVVFGILGYLSNNRLEATIDPPEGSMEPCASSATSGQN